MWLLRDLIPFLYHSLPTGELFTLSASSFYHYASDDIAHRALTANRALLHASRTQGGSFKLDSELNILFSIVSVIATIYIVAYMISSYLPRGSKTRATSPSSTLSSPTSPPFDPPLGESKLEQVSPANRLEQIP